MRFRRTATAPSPDLDAAIREWLAREATVSHDGATEQHAEVALARALRALPSPLPPSRLPDRVWQVMAADQGPRRSVFSHWGLQFAIVLAVIQVGLFVRLLPPATTTVLSLLGAKGLLASCVDWGASLLLSVLAAASWCLTLLNYARLAVSSAMTPTVLLFTALSVLLALASLRVLMRLLPSHGTPYGPRAFG